MEKIIVASVGANVLDALWNECLEVLREEFTEQQFNIWIMPLQVKILENKLILYTPNRYVKDWIREKYLKRIQEILDAIREGEKLQVVLEIGTNTESGINLPDLPTMRAHKKEQTKYQYPINPTFTFDNFVEGKSNQLAKAAARQIAENPGKAYNPVFLYGGVGLGKTHLLLAVGNHILTKRPSAKVLYLHSERFVADMVKALQSNSINEFKRYYRSADALLIDDIQFFAGKDRSQEEFFHTFNSLLEGEKQIMLSCDRYPKEIAGLEERLKSRFGWGLTVIVEPPELETRVAILMSKAELLGINLSYEVAFFIAKKIRSNVRELEGALKRVSANAQFTGREITIEFVQEALKDLLTLQNKLVTLENIQKTVADYYKLKIAELSSKRRDRAIAVPRQIAMALAKELTSHSLVDIGRIFGGRDHSTVLHACRKVVELKTQQVQIAEDYENLLRILTT